MNQKKPHFSGHMQGCQQAGHAFNTRGCDRRGTRGSGMMASLQGENVGAKITIAYDKDLNRDIVNLYLTGGDEDSGEYTIHETHEDIFKPSGNYK